MSNRIGCEEEGGGTRRRMREEADESDQEEKNDDDNEVGEKETRRRRGDENRGTNSVQIYVSEKERERERCTQGTEGSRMNQRDNHRMKKKIPFFFLFYFTLVSGNQQTKTSVKRRIES